MSLLFPLPTTYPVSARSAPRGRSGLRSRRASGAEHQQWRLFLPAATLAVFLVKMHGKNSLMPHGTGQTIGVLHSASLPLVARHSVGMTEFRACGERQAASVDQFVGSRVSAAEQVPHASANARQKLPAVWRRFGSGWHVRGGGGLERTP